MVLMQISLSLSHLCALTHILIIIIIMMKLRIIIMNMVMLEEATLNSVPCGAQKAQLMYEASFTVWAFLASLGSLFNIYFLISSFSLLILWLL